jgi:hypothetical protein
MAFAFALHRFMCKSQADLWISRDGTILVSGFGGFSPLIAPFITTFLQELNREVCYILGIDLCLPTRETLAVVSRRV